MPGPRAVQNLQMPHPQDWQGGQMPRSSPGGGGWAQVELTDALTITPYNTQKRRRRNERTTYGPLRQSSRWVTHPVHNPDRQGLTWTPELKLNFSGRNSFFGGIFCLGYPSRRNENRLRVVPHFSYNYRFSFRKLQILISFRSISFPFAPLRFANYSKPI